MGSLAKIHSPFIFGEKPPVISSDFDGRGSIRGEPVRKKNAARMGGIFEKVENSALAELGRAAGGLEAVLLALLHARIAGQEPSGLQGGDCLQ